MKMINQQCKRSELNSEETMILQNKSVTKKDSLLFLKEWTTLYQLEGIPIPNLYKRLFLGETLAERMEFQYINREYQKRKTR